MVGTTTHCENERAKDDTQDDNHFERREPKFQFTEEFHAKVVDDNDGYHKYGDPYTRIDILGGGFRPVGNDQGGGCELCWR